MSITKCPQCTHRCFWSWEEAFYKFSFDDGDGLVLTHVVVKALRKAGYAVTAERWGWHNVIITSIRLKRVQMIPEDANLGYDNPRDYLPKEIIEVLDAAFPDGEGVRP